MRLEQGQVIDNRYRVLGLIGEGGMSTVYAVEQVNLARRVALKVIHPHLVSSDEAASRFGAEAKVTARLHHESIVQIYDFGYSAERVTYLAMEFLDGESLSRHLRRVGRMQASQAVGVCRQIANALGYAHGHSIVHRDMKPSNVFLLAETGRIKVLDFGLAKLVDAERNNGAETKTGALLGTPQYMAPEQLGSSTTIDQRTDVYALGCLMFELLSGRPVFTGTTYELLEQHARATPPALRALANDVPPGFEAVVMRCLEKKPERRYPSMSEVERALGELHLRSVRRPSTAPVVGQTPIVALGGEGPEDSAGAITRIGTGPSSFYSLAVRRSMFSRENDGIYQAVQESIRFYRDHLKEEYDQLSRQIDRTHALWIGCVVVGFAILLAGVITMFAGATKQGLLATGSSTLVYFIVRIFQQREDHYQKLRHQKTQHLEYGNQWLMAIQSLEAIEDAAERARQQGRLVAVITERLNISLAPAVRPEDPPAAEADLN